MVKFAFFVGIVTIGIFIGSVTGGEAGAVLGGIGGALIGAFMLGKAS